MHWCVSLVKFYVGAPTRVIRICMSVRPACFINYFIISPHAERHIFTLSGAQHIKSLSDENSMRTQRTSAPQRTACTLLKARAFRASAASECFGFN